MAFSGQFLQGHVIVDPPPFQLLHILGTGPYRSKTQCPVMLTYVNYMYYVKIMLGLYVNDSGICNTNIYEYVYIDNSDNGWLIMVAWFCFAFWFQADCISYHQPKARASEARNPSWSCRKSSALLRSKITLDISGCHWNSAIWQNSVRYCKQCKQINMKGWSSWSTASNMFTSDFLSYCIHFHLYVLSLSQLP